MCVRETKGETESAREREKRIEEGGRQKRLREREGETGETEEGREVVR